MKLGELRSSAVGILSASVASLCCLLPLVVVVLGLGSGAFMAVTMRYTYIFLPAGILGTAAGYYLYLRERRRCERRGCAMAGARVNLVLLIVSTGILAMAVALTAMPETTARMIASWRGEAPAGHPTGEPALAGAPLGPAERSVPAPERGASAPPERATLHVDGMT